MKIFLISLLLVATGFNALAQFRPPPGGGGGGGGISASDVRNILIDSNYIKSVRGPGTNNHLGSPSFFGTVTFTNSGSLFHYLTLTNGNQIERWHIGDSSGSTYAWERLVSTNEVVFRARVNGFSKEPLILTRGGGVTLAPDTGHSTSNIGPFRVTGDVTALGDFNLTDTIQFGTAGGGSTIGHYQENDDLTFSNQMQGASFYLRDRLYDGNGVAYALSTEVGGGGSSWSVYSNAVMQITNPVALIFQPGSGIGFNFSSNNNALTITPFLRDGTNQGGFSASGTNKAASFETFPTTATPGFIDLNNTNGESSYRLQAALNPSQATTQAVGMRFFASAAAVELPSREANRFIMTNRMAANATFNLTNTWIGNDFSLFTVGAAAGGTDYTITFVAEAGVRFIHYSDTNGATHYWQSNGVANTYGFVRSIFTNGPVIHVYRGQSINQ